MLRPRVAEFTEYIAPDGKIYPMETGDRFVISEEGLGLPITEYKTQRGPFQHGSTVYDYRLGERTIQLVLRQDACNRFDYWVNRIDLVNAVRPNRTIDGAFSAGVLRKKFPDGSIRDIKVVIQSGPVFVPNSQSYYDMFGFTETLQFVAHDPTFYDPLSRSVLWEDLVDTTALTDLIFPITFPITLGSIAFAARKTITYTGNWLAFPKITVTGPQNGFTIINETTGEFIELLYDIADGEVVTIDLPYGNKTVKNNAGTDLQGVISTDSDIASFHVAPDPEAPNGINTFKVESTGVSGNSRVLLEYNTRYIGL